MIIKTSPTPTRDIVRQLATQLDATLARIHAVVREQAELNRHRQALIDALKGGAQ